MYLYQHHYSGFKKGTFENDDTPEEMQEFGEGFVKIQIIYGELHVAEVSSISVPLA